MPSKITSTTKARQDAIYRWAEIHQPVTVRQLYYRLVTLNLCPKSENGYKAVARVCAEMRKDGSLPWIWITDQTRWQRKPNSYDSLEDALVNMQAFYRRNLWLAQDNYVEIWIEKEALAGVVYPITSDWDVPLMVSKGFASLTYLYNAAETFNHKTDMGKSCHIYYFGDYDPSGVDIRRDIQSKIADYAPRALVYFHDVAVLPHQIDAWDLPTRPTKRSDSRSKGWQGESVELDAIDPQQLRTLVSDSIESCIDADVLDSEMKIQALESETLSEYVSTFYNGTSPNIENRR